MSDIYELLKNYRLEGQKLPIEKYPSPILARVSVPISNFDNQLKELCKNMLFTMYKAPGIGLAAPQVGLNIRMFVIDVDFNREKITKADDQEEYVYSEFNPRIYINPIIEHLEGEIIHEEGCLSLPGFFEEVKRTEKILVSFQDVDGKKHQEEVEGIQSICIQHENDHLDGKVFIDRLSILKRNFIKNKILKERKRNNTQN